MKNLNWIIVSVFLFVSSLGASIIGPRTDIIVGDGYDISLAALGGGAGGPGIAITSTPNSWIQSNPYTLFAGTVTPQSGTTITDVSYKVGAGVYSTVTAFNQSTWSQDSITLAENLNTVYARATASDLKETETSIPVGLDTIDPVISMPADVENEGTGYTTSLTTSNWTETNPDVVRYKIEGGALPGTWVTWAAPYNQVDITVPATEDAYTITLEVTDLSGRSASGEQKYTVGVVVEEVFAATTYTPTSTFPQTINTNINADLVWLKKRGPIIAQHFLLDKGRGSDLALSTDSTAGQGSGYTTVFNFDSSGFIFPSTNFNISNPGDPFMSWSFMEADKFFAIREVTKSSGSDEVVDLSSLGTIGIATVKSLSAGDWYTFHRSLTTGELMLLNTTDAATALGHITVSGTNLTLVNGVIADGDYIVYAWAHDDSAEGIIQCGSYTGTGVSPGPSINIGWKPQLVDIKCFSNSGDNWFRFDTARGLPTGAGSANALFLNLSDSEISNTNYINISSTGFNADSTLSGLNALNRTYIFMAIREP